MPKPPMKPPAQAQPAQAQPAAPSTEVTTLSQELDVLRPQIENVLPEHVSVERFMRIVTTAIVLNPDLRAPNLRRSLLTAATKAATDGLVPDGREGAFVVFGGVVQWMPMVAGVIKKVRNSGELKSLNSNVVYSGDEFDYWFDDAGEHIKHRPDLKGKREEIAAVYAVATTHKGGVYTEVMTRSQIDQVRAASKAPNSPAWRNWYGEMGRKAVIRRLSKRLPMSTDLEQVIQRDDELFDFDKPRAAAVKSGAEGLRKALGLSLDSPPQGNGEDTGADEGEQTSYSEESAIAALKATTSLDELAKVRADVWADYDRKEWQVPIDVEAVANDHRAELEQRAAKL